MSKKVYIFLADGFEDIEGLTVVDLMRRAGITITTFSSDFTASPRPSMQAGYAVAFFPCKSPISAKTVGAAQMAAILPPLL